jgi:hypothetical protein
VMVWTQFRQEATAKEQFQKEQAIAQVQEQKAQALAKEQEWKVLLAAQQREREQAPDLQAISSRWEDGYAIITVKNPSPTRPANVIEATFTITDKKILSEIAKVYPPPPDTGVGAKNHVDDLFFKEGVWAGSSFVYAVRLGLNVEPGGKATDLRLAVLDKRLAHVKLEGDLDVGYETSKGFCSHLNLPNGKIPVVAR